MKGDDLIATANDILVVARGEIGYKESPPNSNRTKYGAWMGLNGQPWCMSFVQWVFAQAGASALLPAKTGSCCTLMRAAKAAGLWVESGYRPGDVVIYDFPGGAATDHCGIVLTPLTNGIRSIEGNTAVGNDSNGGEVMERTRPEKYIVGAVRPRYEEETEVTMDNTPKISKEAVEWAQANGILNGNKDGDLMLSSPCTREMVMVFLHRYHQRFGDN